MGYKWTIEKKEYLGMPNFETSEIESGNYGNGHAKITFLGN